MPSWSWYAIAAAAALIAATGAALLARVLWARQVRRFLVRLVGHKEAVTAGYRTLAAIAQRLAEATDEDIGAFAADPTHLDRKALVEVAGQQRIHADELATMALPKRLWPIAESLAAAATALVVEAARVGESASEGDTLSALAEFDLMPARDALGRGETLLHAECEEFGVEDASVYGGGLYI